MKKIIVIDATHETSTKKEIVPPPPEELGRNLYTLADVATWLEHPSNWVNTTMFIIKWDGITPKISYDHAKRLEAIPEEKEGLYKVVIWDQAQRKLANKRNTTAEELIPEEGQE